MANAKSTKAAASKEKPKEKKEKIFHPQSRKAGQIARTQLRKSKLSDAASKRSKKQQSSSDIYSFFYHAIPEDNKTLTLEELHALVRDIWLTRYDQEIESERAARRKGRPKSSREQQLETIKLTESEEYRTGFEIPDLTHQANVELYRKWDQKELPYIQLLRFIRISDQNHNVVVVSRRGKHPSLLEPQEPELQDEAMDIVEERENSVLRSPPMRLASTITTMDGPV